MKQLFLLLVIATFASCGHLQQGLAKLDEYNQGQITTLPLAKDTADIQTLNGPYPVYTETKDHGQTRIVWMKKDGNKKPVKLIEFKSTLVNDLRWSPGKKLLSIEITPYRGLRDVLVLDHETGETQYVGQLLNRRYEVYKPRWQSDGSLMFDAVEIANQANRTSMGFDPETKMINAK